MSELKPCPFCGGESERIEDHFLLPTNKIIACSKCKVRTKPYSSWEKAIETWNTRTQPNPPLTLEELRGMGGKPVWCEIPSDNPQYGIVIAKHECVSLKCGILQFKYYGKWKAYAHEPKED